MGKQEEGDLVVQGAAAAEMTDMNNTVPPEAEMTVVKESWTTTTTTSTTVTKEVRVAGGIAHSTSVEMSVTTPTSPPTSNRSNEEPSKFGRTVLQQPLFLLLSLSIFLYGKFNSCMRDSYCKMYS